jgi:hypothetical protein
MKYQPLMYGFLVTGGLLVAQAGMAMGEKPVAARAVSTTASVPAAKASGDRQAQCKSFGEAQLKAVDMGAVSGTTVSTSYDDKSGFCTVDIMNKTPGSVFSSRVATNDFSVSPTFVQMRTFRTTVPVQVVRYEAPTRLLCANVVKQKDGKLLCEPAKVVADPFFQPFFMDDFGF